MLTQCNGCEVSFYILDLVTLLFLRTKWTTTRTASLTSSLPASSQWQSRKLSWSSLPSLLLSSDGGLWSGFSCSLSKKQKDREKRFADIPKWRIKKEALPCCLLKSSMTVLSWQTRCFKTTRSSRTFMKRYQTTIRMPSQSTWLNYYKKRGNNFWAGHQSLYSLLIRPMK